jgi:hypothetical protein
MRGKLAPAIALCILQLGDFLSTRLALAHGAVESSIFVNSVGLWGAKLVCVACVAVLALLAHKPSRLWAACVFYPIVVGCNLSLLLR